MGDRKYIGPVLKQRGYSSNMDVWIGRSTEGYRPSALAIQKAYPFIRPWDCIEAMRGMRENCIDAIVTDCPYALEFMGAEWDSFKDKKQNRGWGIHYGGEGFGGFAKEMRPRFSHRTLQEKLNYQEWTTEWATEALRVLKPGGHMLVFGIPRLHHWMMTGVELAGFECKDTLMYLFGTGFPKSQDISKAIDKMAGAERKKGKVKVKGGSKSSTFIRPGNPKDVYEEFPSTTQAEQWLGWGTALKPAWEMVSWFRKPLTPVPFDANLLIETENLFGGALCLLMSNAKSVEKILRSNLNAFDGEVSVSALLIAAVLNMEKSERKFELMGMFKSRETASMCLNIVSSWNIISSVLYRKGSMFTTEMEIKLTTALKILNSFLSTNIPAEVIQAVSRRVGLPFNVKDVGGNFKSDEKNGNDIQDHIAPMFAILKRLKGELSANSVARNLKLIIPSVSFVLSNAITDLVELEEQESLKPDYVPIALFRKPLSEKTIAQNVLRHGVGGLNIDESRVPSGGEVAGVSKSNQRAQGWDRPWMHDKKASGKNYETKLEGNIKAKELGRWPANLILDVEVGQLLDEQSGELGLSKKGSGVGTKRSMFGLKNQSGSMGFGDKGGASRFFLKVDKGDTSIYNGKLCGNTLEGQKAVGMLNGVSRVVEKFFQDAEHPKNGKRQMAPPFLKDMKFIILTEIKPTMKLTILLYCREENIENYMDDLERITNGLMGLNIGDASNAKNINHLKTLANELLELIMVIVKNVTEKNCENGDHEIENIGMPITGNIEKGKNNRFFYCSKVSSAERGDCKHPTMKPLALMRWLVKLVTPPGGIVLDPFMGSGTTAVACEELGYRWVGYEKDPEIFIEARRRIDRERRQLGLF